MKPTYHMDHWEILAKNDPYSAPEQVINILSGVCSDHPEFGENDRIYTSKIIGYSDDPPNSLGTIETQNSFYVLGHNMSEQFQRYLSDHGYESLLELMDKWTKNE